ncbi:sugar ABC transporter substrate-binding protein [Streptomyces sp. NPDC021098]
MITGTNDYMQNWATGARAYARKLRLPLRVINSYGDSQQQFSQVQSAMASGKKVVLNLHPVASADPPAIAKAVARTGGYMISSWNKPADAHPVDFGPHWVTHMGFDGVEAGRWTATKLFEAMNGKGGIIALKGVLDSTASKQRYQGLLKALADFPNVELLATDSANWDRQTAYQKTQTLLSKYRSRVTGIWTGSDSMTLGAVAAAQQAGISVKATGIDCLEESMHSIKNKGPIVAAWFTDPFYSGAMGLAMAYGAATGALEVASMTPEQREGTYRQVGVDAANVDSYITRPSSKRILTEVDKGYFDRLIGPPLPGA